MPRVAPEEIDRLEREVSIERLASARGIALVRRGTVLTGKCPFHEKADDTSLTVDTKANTWNCVVCNLNGGVLAWVMRSEGISKRHAVELLRADVVPATPPSARRQGRQRGPTVEHSTARKLGTPFDTTTDDPSLLAQVVGYYHAALTQTPEALAYLEARGLRSAEIIEHFKLGYANRTLAYRLPAKNRVAGASIRGRLEMLGLLRDSGHEHFNGAIVIPVLDEHGRVAQLYGRRLASRVPVGSSTHLHTSGPTTGLWNVGALPASTEIILCRSVFDGLAVWCAGHRNVVSTFGIDGLTAADVELLRRHGIARIRIAYRRDDAAERAAIAAAALLNDAGIETWKALFPNGMDANDYAVKAGAGSLEEALRKADWIGKGKPSAVAISNETIEAAPIIEPTVAVDVKPTLTSESPPSQSASTGTSNDVIFRFGDRAWRARWIGKAAPESMKVNLLVSRGDVGFHVDTLDLYSARQRTHYVSMAAVEIGVDERVVKRDIGEVLLQLEEAQERAANATSNDDKKKRPKLSADEEREALDLLRDPRLLDRILADFDQCGVVGEGDNKLVGYLAAVSRKLDHPLAVVIQSSSAAGKSSLMEAVLDFVPEEDRRSFSAMTGQSLFYMGDGDIAHKVLSIAEEEGVARAAYPLKVLQSEGQLTIASTGKDPMTGRLTSHQYTVQGPVAIFTTTTAIDVDEELLSRCIVLTVDERPEQTRAIHDRQRRAQTLDGLFDRTMRDHLVHLHRNAQRLLRPVAVVVPFVADLTFADYRVRARRDHRKYLALIEAVAFLHQHQRPVKTAERGGRTLQYIEATTDDLAVVDRLTASVVSSGLDELPPTTRRLLGLLDAMVANVAKMRGMARSDVRFSRREARECIGVGGTQLWVHLRRLVEAEYLIVHPSRRGRGVVYELAYVGDPTDTTASVRGDERDRSGDVRGKFGPDSGGVRGTTEGTIPRRDGSIRDSAADPAADARSRSSIESLSYPREPA